MYTHFFHRDLVPPEAVSNGGYLPVVILHLLPDGMTIVNLQLMSVEELRRHILNFHLLQISSLTNAYDRAAQKLSRSKKKLGWKNVFNLISKLLLRRFGH